MNPRWPSGPTPLRLGIRLGRPTGVRFLSRVKFMRKNYERIFDLQAMSLRESQRIQIRLEWMEQTSKKGWKVANGIFIYHARTIWYGHSYIFVRTSVLNCTKIFSFMFESLIICTTLLQILYGLYTDLYGHLQLYVRKYFERCTVKKKCCTNP